MKARDDIEVITLRTGERFVRVSGDGKSRLVPEVDYLDALLKRIWQEQRPLRERLERESRPTPELMNMMLD